MNIIQQDRRAGGWHGLHCAGAAKVKEVDNVSTCSVCDLPGAVGAGRSAADGVARIVGHAGAVVGEPLVEQAAQGGLAVPFALREATAGDPVAQLGHLRLIPVLRSKPCMCFFQFEYWLAVGLGWL